MSALTFFIYEVSSSDSVGVILRLCLFASKDVHAQSFDWAVIGKQIFELNFVLIRDPVDLQFSADQY